MNDSLQTFISKIAKEIELPETKVVQPDEEFRQLPEWSSMNALIVLSFINLEYEKSFTAQDLSACKTMRDIYNVISK